MASICVVKFDENGSNGISLVPESYLQSAKNVKIRINGDYLFADKNDRQRRGRGKLLFQGTLEECKEYCEGDSSLKVDSLTWLSNTTFEPNTNNKVLEHTTFKQKNKKNDLEKSEISKKQPTNNSSITILKTKPIQHNQQNTSSKKKQQLNKKNINDEIESFDSNIEYPILVDLSNNGSFDNNESSKHQTHINRFKHQTKSTVADPEAEDNIFTNDMQSDDELTLPRHIQIELKKNRKTIVDLEAELKQLKHMSIPFPTPEESDYLRRVLSVVDMRNELAKTRAISCGTQLGLTEMELLEATGNGKLSWKKIVVNLIQACFKNVDLQYENYTSLRNHNSELIDNISAYVKAICPTAVFTDTQFSACISGKCHHMKSDNKKKANKLANLLN